MGGASCEPYFCCIFCFLHELHVQIVQIYVVLMHCTCKSGREQNILQKSKLHEVPPKRKFKECYCIFRFGQLVCYEICKTSGALMQYREKALNKRKQTK